MLYHLLKNVRKKHDGSGLYHVVEATWRYEFDKQMLDNLDEFMRKFERGRLSHWYEDLNADDKKKVKRESAYK